MNLIDFFSHTFKNFKSFNKKENFELLRFSHEKAVINFEYSNSNNYAKIFNKIPDSFYFQIDDDFEYDSNEDDISELFDYLENTSLDLEYSVEFHIMKKNQIDNMDILNVYDINTFLYIYGHSVESYYSRFNKLFKNYRNEEKYIFNLIFDRFYLETETLVFTTNVKDIFNDKIKISRTQILSNFLYNSKLISKNNLNLIPDDFHIIKSANLPIKVKRYFNKMEELLSLIFISNLTKIKENTELEIIIDGMKKISANLKFNVFYKNGFINDFYRIYEWIYSNMNLDNVCDKLGLARNIISIHISDNTYSYLSIDSGTYDSIISSHQIYLKDNVDKYLIALNSISDSLFDIKNKVNDLFSEYLTSFRANIYIYISFLISFLIKHLFGKSTMDNNIFFTFDVLMIIVIVVIISFIYKQFTITSVTKKGARLEKNIENLKLRYESVLDPNDIDNIFNDININDDLKNEIENYNDFWVGLNSAVLIISLVLFLNNYVRY